MGRRPGRAAAATAAAALKNSTQTFEDAEDEQMQDGTSEVGSFGEGDEDENPDEDEATPAPESEVEELPRTPAVVKKKLGRPPKNRAPDEDQDGAPTPGSASRGRGRGRGAGRGGSSSRGGGRGKGRGGPFPFTRQPIDKEGNLMDVVDDEVALPEDPDGETKVDKLGNLLGGREYRCRTFTVFGRGQRLYMLSTEPARCVGFRDSYLFFNKHKRLHKIIIEEDEKKDLIARDLIPHSYKGRAIGICTARSVFREFGALIVVGGKRIIDDYEVAKAKAEGVEEGQLADPKDIIKPGEEYNKNQYVAWHGASSVYHSGQPSVPLQTGKGPDKKRGKVVVTDVTWMHAQALEASRFNSAMAANRRRLLNGVYDVHTNTMQYPKIMQPTHARIEQIDDYAVDREVQANSGDEAAEENKPKTMFSPVKPIYSRNYLIVDTVFESPPYSHLGVPGPDGAGIDLGFNGLNAVSDEIKDLLPLDCRKAFDEALAKELEWKARWGPESTSTSRRDPAIDKGVV